MPRISLIHATPVAIDPVVAAFRENWPDASVYNLLEDSLSADVQAAGSVGMSIVERFRTLGRYAADSGADAILFTCSAFGEAIEAVAEERAPLPVLKPNEAMFEDALQRGSRIGMIATFEPSIPSMRREFEAMAASRRPGASLETACIPAAMAALAGGDAATHNRLIAETARQFAGCDVLMLAQFSMAPALDLVRDKVSIPVLTSPTSAIGKLRAALGHG